MKRMVILLSILICSSAYAQHFNFDKYGNLIWQSVYETKMSSQDIHKALCKSTYLCNVEKLDSTFYMASLRVSEVDYEAAGYKKMNLPLYLINSHIGPADVIIEYKPGKYKITLKNIDLTPISSFDYGSLHDMAVAEDGYFTDMFTKYAGNIYHYYFTVWLDLNGILTDW